MFSTFPDGLPGAGLLLLRVGVGVALIAQGASYFAGWPQLKALTLTVALVSAASGLSLLLGYLTPLAGILAGVISAGGALSWFPVPNLDFFEPRLTAVLATVIVVALACLGPGAFSLDARRFGRREIIIPGPSQES